MEPEPSAPMSAWATAITKEYVLKIREVNHPADAAEVLPENGVRKSLSSSISQVALLVELS